ncbi:hypothetical protein MKZ38_002746 [Zalerion maritima]|uniref:Uncharacterized protein n=1 Tax=Zalerion maritima TaxID=339359 RepID=A0AAD5RPC5_9PEZI|nr:hypothetical protein MKZ38_002746 [Zalerion maritima]
MDPTFTDAEKRFVLAEIIKASSIDVGILVDLVKSHNVEPQWLSMQVPNGRNLGQCINATESLFERHIPYPNLKRKPPASLVEIAPKRQAVEQPRPVAIPRVIQPRPASNGYNPHPSPTVTAPATATATPPTATGRKRGRPSKAEKAEKEAAQLRAGGHHFGVFPNRQGQPGTYPPISAAPTQPPVTQKLPPISTVQDYPPSSSVATVYNVVSGPQRKNSPRHEQVIPPLSKHQTDEQPQETRPADSNPQWQPGMASENADASHQEAENYGRFPSQPRQMPTPMEPRQLASYSGMNSPLVGRISAPERSNSPMSQHKPESHSPHLNPAPAGVVP